MNRDPRRPIQLGAGGFSPSEKAIRCLSTRKGVESERHSAILPQRFGSGSTSYTNKCTRGSRWEADLIRYLGGARSADPCEDEPLSTADRARDRSMSSRPCQDKIVCPPLVFSLYCPHLRQQSPLSHHVRFSLLPSYSHLDPRFPSLCQFLHRRRVR